MAIIRDSSSQRPNPVPVTPAKPSGSNTAAPAGTAAATPSATPAAPASSTTGPANGHGAANVVQNAPASGRVMAGSADDGFVSGTTQGTQAPVDLATGPHGGDPRLLGLTQADLQGAAAEARPHLEQAASAVMKGDFEAVARHLQDAAKAGGGELAERAVAQLAARLPDEGAAGIARALLTDPAVVSELVGEGKAKEALSLLMKGDLAGGLQLLGDVPAIQANVMAQLAEQPQVASLLNGLGLETADLQSLGSQLPTLIDAGLAAAEGDTQRAVELLQQVATSPEAKTLATKSLNHLAEQMPEGPARDLLTHAGFVRAVLDSEVKGEVLQAALEGRGIDALRAVLGDEAIVSEGIAALATNEDVQAGLEKLGISVEGLQAAADAAPDLLEAAVAAASGDEGAAMGHLGRALNKAPELAREAVNHFAQQLPEGAARDLLTDPAFVEALAADPSTAEALEAFGRGDLKEGLRALSRNEGAIGAAVDVLAQRPEIQAGLEQLGLTPEALKGAADAVPALVDAAIAAEQGDRVGTVDNLAAAIEAAPELTTQLINNYAAGLPDGPAKDLLTDEAFVKSLAADPGTREALEHLVRGDQVEALRALSNNEPALKAAVDVLAKRPEVASFLEEAGITPAALKGAADAVPELLDAALLASEGDIKGAVGKLLEAGQQAPELVAEGIAHFAGRLPEEGAVGLARSVLTDPKAVQALLEDGEGRAAVARLLRGDLSAVEDIVTADSFGPVIDALATNPDVVDGLERLGFTAEDLKGAAQGIPDLLQAAQSLGQGDFQQALVHLKDAVGAIPEDTIARAIANAASRLPDSGPAGILRSLLTDEAFAKELVTNDALKSAFEKITSGELNEGLKEILSDDEFGTAAGNALATNPELMEMLEPFGIRNGDDLASIGKGLVDLMEAQEAIRDGRTGDALRNVGEALADVPSGMRARVAEALADSLGLEGWAKDAVVGLAGLLGNETIGRELGTAIDAMRRGDVPEFAQALARIGAETSKSSPDTAIAFVNTLGNLPGSLGALFQDRELNEAMIRSGASEELFNAVEKLASGDIGGAMSELTSAGYKLLTQGDNLEVKGYELPISLQGMENFARLFGRFVDALPDDIKAQIMETAAKFGAKAGLKAVPFIGSVVSGVSAIGSVKDLIKEMNKDPRDTLGIALAAGQLGLDVAGMVPGLGAVTGSLQVVLGTAQVLEDAHDLITDVNQFQEELAGF